MKQLFFFSLLWLISTSIIIAQKKEKHFKYEAVYEKTISITLKDEKNLNLDSLKRGLVLLPFEYTDSLFIVYLKEILPQDKMEKINQTFLTMQITFTNKGEIIEAFFTISKDKVDFISDEELYKFYKKVMNTKLDPQRWVLRYSGPFQRGDHWDYAGSPIFLHRINKHK